MCTIINLKCKPINILCVISFTQLTEFFLSADKLYKSWNILSYLSLSMVELRKRASNYTVLRDSAPNCQF